MLARSAAFLVEAADDICYHVMDVEDGYKTGNLTYDEIENLHRPWLPAERLTRGQQIADRGRRVEYFRAVTIDVMVRDAVHAFSVNYVGLMDGSFDRELTASIPRAAEFKAFKDTAKQKVYSARPVVEIEACGFEVIGGLLASFVSAINVKARNQQQGKAKSRTLLSLLPAGSPDVSQLAAYDRTLVATDYVSGMTDSFAVELYQRIRGISLP